MIYATMSYIHSHSFELTETRVAAEHLGDVFIRADRIALLNGIKSYSVEPDKQDNDPGSTTCLLKIKKFWDGGDLLSSTELFT